MTMAKLPLAIGIKLLDLGRAGAGDRHHLLLQTANAQLIALLVLFLLYLLYVPALNRLIIASYANALCEKYLNTKIEGAPTNIGLRPENWDDTEYNPAGR